MYDPQRREWAMGMLKELGLPTKILPAIVASGTILGQLKSDVANECGAKVAPIIAPACHDTGSAVAAVPAQGEGWCYISSGTWSLMGVELTEPIINAKSLRYNYTNEGGVGGTIRFLKNIMGLWLVQECRRQFAAEGKDYDYATLTEMARQIDVARTYTHALVDRSVAGDTDLVAEVCFAKNTAVEAGEWVANQALQLFGGLGYMREAEVERVVLLQPLGDLGQPGVAGDDGRAPGRRRLGGDHPERFREDRRDDAHVGKGEKVLEVAMLELSTEQRREHTRPRVAYHAATRVRDLVLASCLLILLSPLLVLA